MYVAHQLSMGWLTTYYEYADEVIWLQAIEIGQFRLKMDLLEYKGDCTELKQYIAKQGSEGWESGDLGSRNEPTVYPA